MSLLIALPAAVSAALVSGASTAVQHSAARDSAPGVRGLLGLLRHPRWLASVGGDAASLVLQVIALATGPVVLVEPLLVLAVPVAMLVSRALAARRVSGRDCVACVAILAALGVFFGLVGSPGPASLISGRAALTATLVTLAASGMVCLAVRPRSGAVKAGVYGAVAGGGFGVAAVLIGASRGGIEGKSCTVLLSSATELTMRTRNHGPDGARLRRIPSTSRTSLGQRQARPLVVVSSSPAAVSAARRHDEEGEIDASGARKAAVLIVQLGAERAAAVLAAMRESEVEQITAEIARLDDIDPGLAEQVLSEFRDLLLARGYYSRGGVAFAEELLEASLGADRAHAIMERLHAALTEAPFRFVRDADPRHLASFINDEHPQTIAVVVAHLGAEQAAKILAELEPPLLAEVAHRIAVMGQPAPDAVRLVESVLERNVASVLRADDRSDVGGVGSLVDIINRSERGSERLILEGLEARDADLAEQVRARMFMFEDVVHLDDKAIQLLIRQIEAVELATALKGVREEVRRKILANMSERAADNLTEEIAILGPVRVATVEEAQARIVHVIRQLEESGQVLIQRGNEDQFIE